MHGSSATAWVSIDEDVREARPSSSSSSTTPPPVPASLSTTGAGSEESSVEGRGGRPAPVFSRASAVVLTLCVMAGYGTAMFVNASSTRMLTQRYSTGTTAGWVIVNVLDPLTLIGLTRAAAVALTLTLLSGRRKGGGPPTPLPSSLPLLGGLSGVANGLGYAAYLALVKLGGIALWSALVGLYIVAPSLYFMLRRGESAGRMKVLGVLCCAVAAVCLGVGKDAGEANPLDAGGAAPPPPPQLWVQLALLASVVACWGVADGAQALASQSIPLPLVTAAGGAGFLLVASVSLTLAWLASLLSSDLQSAYGGEGGCGGGGAQLLTNATAPGAAAAVAAVVAPCAPGLSTRVGGLALVAAAQCVAMGSWYGMCKLTASAEASSVIPIISLYTVLTSLASVVLWGERLNVAGWVGLVLGGGGILAVGYA